MLGLKTFVRVQTFWWRPFVHSHNFCHPVYYDGCQKCNQESKSWVTLTWYCPPTSLIVRILFMSTLTRIFTSLPTSKGGGGLSCKIFPGLKFYISSHDWLISLLKRQDKVQRKYSPSNIQAWDEQFDKTLRRFRHHSLLSRHICVGWVE